MMTPSLRKQHERCADCGIRNRAVCSYCGPQELGLLDTIKFYRSYDPGQEIVAAGEQTDFLGSVVEGVVSLSKTMPDGRRQMVGLMFASDFVGRPMRPIAPYDAVAVTPVRLCLFNRGRFERLLKDTPVLEKRLLEMTLDELDAARDWMLLLGRKSAREKIASFLAILARRAASADNVDADDGFFFDLPLTREQMADYLGLTIETVSRQITALKKDGVVEFPDARRCRVPDFVALLDAAGEDSDGGMID
ncbi:Crp/Fnr family transcriptional regulator [Limibaculum sp. M0105]|uniref:Crp/Fnr family transcriptional regulator n=1 Tax=Thermohalobaculum xanthum TaxID=2753746 RepID=A0A8J7M6I5_9RHOB|nr:Crp/Fnr family transcriptional regulator [Thermohalobaculum xanthum]